MATETGLVPAVKSCLGKKSAAVIAALGGLKVGVKLLRLYEAKPVLVLSKVIGA
jgi:hypothetical protein